ncbi:putative toxin-antitoxin system toxin component, PIN family [Lacipirellula sp.]|uniref:putative toxin-antitoxin system toxin component, PIN family n=1 Tax=Lacipirellula sp. TaxID=2691419 RepID=UPI003D1328A8
MIVVYDCMLFFRSAARPERVSRLFELVDSGKVTLALGAEVLAEIHDVLNRTEHQSKFATLTPEAVTLFLQHFLRTSFWIDAVPEQYELKRDPKDSKYINLALASGAAWLVTWDKDLLELSRSDSAVGQEFRALYPRLRIGTPENFLAESFA